MNRPKRRVDNTNLRRETRSPQNVSNVKNLSQNYRNYITPQNCLKIYRQVLPVGHCACAGPSPRSLNHILRIDIFIKPFYDHQAIY